MLAARKTEQAELAFAAEEGEAARPPSFESTSAVVLVSGSCECGMLEVAHGSHGPMRQVAARAGRSRQATVQGRARPARLRQCLQRSVENVARALEDDRQ